jgi:hypothetical protein
MRLLTTRLLLSFLIAPLTLWLVPASAALAQEQQEQQKQQQEERATPVQIVALDECDPTTFKGRTSFRVLYSSLDAFDSRGQMTVVSGR